MLFLNGERLFWEGLQTSHGISKSLEIAKPMEALAIPGDMIFLIMSVVLFFLSDPHWVSPFFTVTGKNNFSEDFDSQEQF